MAILQAPVFLPSSAHPLAPNRSIPSSSSSLQAASSSGSRKPCAARRSCKQPPVSVSLPAVGPTRYALCGLRGDWLTAAAACLCIQSGLQVLATGPVADKFLVHISELRHGFICGRRSDVVCKGVMLTTVRCDAVLQAAKRVAEALGAVDTPWRRGPQLAPRFDKTPP